MYLVGGFVSFRDLTSSMVTVDLVSGEERDCDPVPVSAVKLPAVDRLGDKQIVMVINKTVHVYNIDQDKWRQVNVEEFPDNIEFNRAMTDHSCDIATVYLTAHYKSDIYKLQFLEDNSCQIVKVGNFTSEARNTCLVGKNIFNFVSEEFSYESLLECFNLNTNACTKLWETDSPEWSFAPYNSLGCFPLVNYDIIKMCS